MVATSRMPARWAPGQIWQWLGRGIECEYCHINMVHLVIAANDCDSTISSTNNEIAHCFAICEGIIANIDCAVLPVPMLWDM